MLVVAIAIRLAGPAAAGQPESEYASFACGGDISAATAAILRTHREGLAAAAELLSSVDRLTVQLVVMRRADQDIRILLIALLTRCGVDMTGDAMRPVRAAGRVIDKVNQAQLKSILRVSGWPVISKYGVEADQSAFLVVQHADRDPAFQREVLKILEDKYRERETSGENYALLFDRVRVADSRPQRYGTQGECHGGKWKPMQIEDPSRVDYLRTSVGLEPLREYTAKVAGMLCGATIAK